PTTCALPGCDVVIEQSDSGGPPRRYCSSAHRAAARKQRQVARAQLTAALETAVAEAEPRTERSELPATPPATAPAAIDAEPATERIERPAPSVPESVEPATQVVDEPPVEEPEPVTVRIRPALSGAARPPALRNPFRSAATATGAPTKRVLRPEKRPSLRS